MRPTSVFPTFRRSLYALACAPMLLYLGASAGLVHAAEAPAAVAPRPASWEAKPAHCSVPPRPAESMGDATYDAVRRATELMTQKKNDEALAKLSAFTERGEPFDKAMVHYNLGIAHSAKEQYLAAAESFARALSFGVLPLAQAEQLQFNLGQLYVAAGQFDKGTEALQKYLAEACGTVSADAYVVLASALAEQKRYAEAIPQIDIAMSKAKAPKESWLQFKLGAQYEIKEYRAAAETLIQLIAMKPDKPEYWKQLSGVLLEMDDKAQSLAVMALAEKQGFMEKPADLQNLYNIYMMLDVPIKAGLLMEQALAENKVPADEKTLESIANAWLNARESAKAEAALKKVASVADRGEYYFRLGGMYGDQERWQESKEMLELALAKGNLKRPGDVHFRMAVADYRLGDLRAAVAALEKAQAYGETRQQATEWHRHLSAELQAQQTATVAAAVPPG